MISIFTQGIRIVGHETSLPHGSTVHLNCSTDLTANTMEWLGLKGTVLRKGSGPSLELTDTPGSSAAYICRVNSTFGSQNKTVNVHLLQEATSPSESMIVIPVIVVIIFVLVIVMVVIIVAILLMR